MTKRLSVTVDDVLQSALKEAPRRLKLPRSASQSERLREYALLGYKRLLEEELDRKRLETYTQWADDPEILDFAHAGSRRAAKRGLFED